MPGSNSRLAAHARALGAFAVLALAGCSGAGSSGFSIPGGAMTIPVSGNGGSSSSRSATSAVVPAAGPAAAALAPVVAPRDAAHHTNVVPDPPAAGTSRPGQIYSVYVAAKTGHTVAFTVFEPATIAAGETYPIVLHASGFGGTRATSLGGTIAALVAAGYGVISFDQTGTGETTGKASAPDPDVEGTDDLAVLDWAEAKLTWLKVAPTLDGKDPSEGVFGAIGSSSGALYEELLVNVDPRHRLRAIVPDGAPFDLDAAVFPGGVANGAWDAAMLGLGAAGESQAAPAALAPYAAPRLKQDLTSGSESAETHDYDAYRSASYFCDGRSVPPGPRGTAPRRAATSRMPIVDAMIWTGVRDTFAGFDQAYDNYMCLARGGGDVRFLSSQAGDGALGVVADPGLASLPASDGSDSRCGALTEDAATLAFFAQDLKGLTGAASPVPATPCISLAAGDGIVLPKTPPSSTYDLGSIALVAGAQQDVASTGAVLVTGAKGGTVVAGIPHVSLEVARSAAPSPSPVPQTSAASAAPAAPAPSSAASGSATPVVYVGLGVMHATNPVSWDLVDNALTPIRGFGAHELDLAGGGVRLAAGDRLAVVAFGSASRYALPAALNAPAAAVVPVTLTGKIRLPVFASPPPAL